MAFPIRVAGQAVVYAAFAVFVGYFSTSPSYRHFAEDTALIKMSFSHAGAAKSPCRRLTPEEIAALAPNMRHAEDCPRQRVDLLVELALDGRPQYRAWLPPSGLAGDGESTVYEKFAVAPGAHHISARLRDSAREDGFDYRLDRTVELAAGQNFVIDFNASTGGFVFR